MIPGIVTWDELGRLNGCVLAILNSPPDDLPTAAALFDQLQGPTDVRRLHVIAGPEWWQWLKARRVPEERILFSVDAGGTSLELNHFLESPTVLSWAGRREFDVVVGSAPHAVYNDEVKSIFERRLILLMGTGHYLAHTLPNPYVFVLDLAALLVRASRELKLQEYSATCYAIVDDLYASWIELGRPAVSDQPGSCRAFQTVRTHLRPELLAFDEASPIPLETRVHTRAFADLVLHLRGLLREHDERLADRNAAVDLRDSIIANLRRERETLIQRMRRKLRSL